jgi:hypothetical protein
VTLRWLEAGGGYALALDGGRLVARGPRGTVLRSVPAAVRESALGVQLRELSEWLVRHERECAERVETWMVRSLPVPATVLVACWPDPAWRRALRDSVAGPLRGAELDRDLTGFLRGADPGRGIGIVTADGETAWSPARTFLVPHPVLIADLDDFRAFATELQVEQVIPQLHRETWARPALPDPAADRVEDFAAARFAQLRDAIARCRGLGYAITGGSAVTRVWEDARLVEARYWIGGEETDAPTSTGDLVWVAPGGRQLPLAEVGPVAFSEGMRMAALVHAGRAPEPELDL